MRTVVLTTLLLAALPGVAFAANEPAQARTEAFIAAFKRVKSPVKSPADRQANEKVYAELDGFLDFDSLTSEAIKPRADKLTAEQRSAYAKKFKELVRLISYPNSGAFFDRAKLTYKPVQQKEGKTLVVVNAHDPKDDLETELTLHWAQKADGLRIVDVSFDGESLVKDYQNQFVRIIDKDGGQGLIKKLDERRADLAKEQGEAPATGGSEKTAPAKGKK